MSDNSDRLIITQQFVEELDRRLKALPDAGDVYIGDEGDDEQLVDIEDEVEVNTNPIVDTYDEPSEPPVLSQPLDFPWPMTVAQSLVFTGDRSVVVNLVVTHPDIVGASDYEVRITKV